MPIATYDQYCQMLDNAKKGKFAYPAINITSLETINGVMEGFAEAGCDGIIQVSSGGGQHATGSIKDMALGAKILAEAAHSLAARYPVAIALHTDHCHPKNLGPFMDPLIAESEKRVAAGQSPLFNSHMFDGSELDLEENIKVSKTYLQRLAKLNMLLEIETGVVGGEEDGHDTSGVSNEKLYTTPGDMVRAYEELNSIGRFMLAATFGNVHGVYKPGNVKLTPTILRDGQAAVIEKFKTGANPLDLVFHGGSGSTQAEIHETLDYGVIKMNVDTDTQYAFTRPIADHMFKNYDGVLKVDQEIGNKKAYDPRGYLKLAMAGIKARVIEACQDLRAVGTSILK
ncbi:MAG: class II fructose-bisphosphate aldolase [Planctomycetota bacterium]|nr:MAG: class II fructose-bisphosphate aldolase [Planctomycetota bacterium]